ncbi:NADPH-dependent 2,4-dienoyl-CoA reductase [Microbacterium hydrocarbonoxydans]|uniref:NADPH-dependent 2,4-dienoyl-CoA reductase n=1 Tax=Microbacterium hydrocarbonoxydans TaxID=273678 RepID=UPI0007BBC0D1|nr:NADPH-dependent 2,4-dienoyl-CoA reductase [Microbacterium hydrocarbonoxydans]GAT74353.1 2,4-dienoyl-CoA reductase [Microbacterium sp. HM58-2]
MVAHPALFTPVRVGAVTLPNRVLMGSMHLGLEEVDGGFERLAAFYAERARHGVALMVTGGIAPNEEGRPWEDGAVMTDAAVEEHRLITDAVHAEGGRILLQLLHFGRYAHHADLVAPSALQAPISERPPRAMTHEEILRTIRDFASAASRAIEAGYDGVEIMGSEGYLLNEFLAPATNLRDDAWGGDAERRRLFPLRVAAAVREAIGAEAILSFRLSAIDLVDGGSTAEETIALARALEAAGVDLLNTGVGWHESRVPTIATLVPRAAFAEATRRIRARVGIPVVASNRISTPEVAERLILDGDADLVSMARPFLADPAFLAKAARGEAASINTCIGCNQACIDHTLTGRVTSCLVNPRAGHETVLTLAPTRRAERIAVVGAGPAGLAFAVAAAERGHRIVLFERRPDIGGQFDIARRIPGKEEFAETLRYYRGRIEELGIDLRLGADADADALDGFDRVVVATGVRPRRPDVPGADLPHVLDYAEVVREGRPVGARVAILGAGGIGFDVASFVSQAEPSPGGDALRSFERAWGISYAPESAGGAIAPVPLPPARTVRMMQRKPGRLGAGLGKTTGWIHRAELRHRDVEMLAGVDYLAITEAGVLVAHEGAERLVEADTVVLCTGQESNRALVPELAVRGIRHHVIGGADVAAEVDAKRAIRQGVELAATI